MTNFNLTKNNIRLLKLKQTGDDIITFVYTDKDKNLFGLWFPHIIVSENNQVGLRPWLPYANQEFLNISIKVDDVLCTYIPKDIYLDSYMNVIIDNYSDRGYSYDYGFNDYLKSKGASPKIISNSNSSESNYDILTSALEMALKNEKNKKSKGLWLEFGVFSGKTINHIAKMNPSQKIYGFDSFLGLPEDWRGNMTKGYFDREGRMPEVQSNVALIPGWFSDTLPLFCENHVVGNYISFLHVDCDIYSSTVDIFDNLGEQIVEGTVILFDEFYGYDGWQNHECKAWEEFTSKNKIKYEYVSYAGLEGEQLVVQIL